MRSRCWKCGIQRVSNCRCMSTADGEVRSKWPDRAAWAAGRWWKGMEGYLCGQAQARGWPVDEGMAGVAARGGGEG